MVCVSSHEERSLLWKGVESFVLLLFVTMLILALAQVLFRYVLQISVPWTEEAARWIYIWQIFVGSALCAREGIHLRVDIIEKRLSAKASRLLDMLILFLSMAFLLGIFFGSISMMQSVRTVRASTFRISMQYLYLSLPVSIFLIFVASFSRIASVLKQSRGRRTEQQES